MEALYLCLVELDDDADLQTALQAEIQQHPVCWTTCCHTLHQFLDRFTEDDAEPLSVSFDQVVACIHSLLKVDNLPFLAASKPPDSLSKARLDEWENWFADLAVSPTCAWNTIPAIPRQPCRYKVVLHAYAGRRRRGDIEWYMTSLAEQFPDHIVVTVLAIRGVKQETLILGSFTAQGSSERSPDAPWGLPSLRLGELRQVMPGTLLLGFAFKCVAALATCTGAGLLEHPRDPEHPDYVSVWRLPILRMLLALPRMRLISLSQGLFRAPSPKPTW